MTAQATAEAPLESRTLGELLASIPLHPSEGWVSLFATGLMAIVVALSFVDAGWTPGRPGDSGFLPWVALIGVGFGIAGAKLGWGRWRTHFVGALFAGVALPLIVGGIVRPDAGWDIAGLGTRVAATYLVAYNVWQDLVVHGRPYTTESAYYHLIFGGLVWGAGLLAGFTVFGHRRPLDAVVVLGLVLLADMALTRHDQLLLLITFTSAALLLLIRTHVFEEEVTWARRKIGDPAAVRSLYLVAGAQFVTVAILGSVLLTATASSAPLQGLWKDLPQHLTTISQWLQRFAPPGGDIRGLGAVTFGDGAITNGKWQPSNSVAFRARFDRTERQQFKWRAGTFAEYTGFGWNWGPTRIETTAPRSVLLDGDVQGDKPIADGRREIDFSLSIDSFIGPTVFGPNTLLTVDRDANAVVTGTGGFFTTVETQGNSGGYSVTALVPDFKATTGGITEPRLRAAGTDYPAELKLIYTRLPKDALGPSATALLGTIKAAVHAPSYADPSNPYDLARTIETYLHDDDNFTYDPDVVDVRNAQCQGVSTVECFARIRRGYCDFYASTMTVLLRASGVPARVAYGFLPGDRGTDGVEVVGAWGAHYWVEVYFPGIGWVEFDPTGGGVGVPQAIPTGSPLPATPKPSLRAPGASGPGVPTFATGGGGGSTQDTGAGIGPFIAIALILLVGFGALAFAAVRRTPRKPMHPDQAWGSVSRWAGRIGLAPRPSQTVYEYAGALGDSVPAARVELTTIARAKVEVAYGRSELGADRLHRIAEAYQRLRFALLGVILRRVLRRGPRPGRRAAKRQR
jgi:transglutaminase-like putative cysteine protease